MRFGETLLAVYQGFNSEQVVPSFVSNKNIKLSLYLSEVLASCKITMLLKVISLEVSYVVDSPLIHLRILCRPNI